MALAANQQTQYDQLIKAGAGTSQAMQAALLVPAAQAPITPAPVPSTPAPTSASGFSTIGQLPQNPTTTVNVNAAPANTTQTQTQQPNTSQGSLQMRGNGSIVDLLNSAGVDSSQANRQKLAQQYGVQNYDFSAAKNKELADKYLSAFNANKGMAVPDTGAQAASALDNYFKENAQQSQEDPQANFFDSYMSMNPIVKTMYDSISQLLSSTGTQQTFKEEFDSLMKDQGIPGLQTELMNVQNIMDGTEDDIRDEITKVGGMATESQVQALKGARNKTLLKQANSLQQQLALKQDYVDQIMNFSKLDREQVEKDVDRKLGLTEKLATIQEQMNNAAKDNIDTIVKQVGYTGLAAAYAQNPNALRSIETQLNLPKGALSKPAFLAASKPTISMPASVQEYEYAKANGFKGTFTDYQNEDANRKKSIAAAGVSGLTPNQINTTVNQIAGNFDNEPTVKEFNTIKRNVDTFNNLGTSATDDIQRVYTFAKVADPNSAVKEGEYASIEKYAQAVMQRAGLKVSRVFTPTGILTPEARSAMRQTLNTSLVSAEKFYNQTKSEYQRQIDDAYSGKPRQITDYSVQTVTKDGKVFDIAGARAVGYSEQEIKDYIESH